MDKSMYREGMARLCAAVNIITSSGEAGLGGFTASAVCSVTDDPPTLLVCINRGSPQAEVFRRNKTLCVNVLSHKHEEVSGVFAGRGRLSAEDRFKTVAYTKLETGSPVLEDAIVAFDCEITHQLDIGTHNVMFAEVRAMKIGAGGSPLLYFERSYHAIRSAAVIAHDGERVAPRTTTA